MPLARGAHHPVTHAEAVAALIALDADGAVELALTALRDPRTEVRHIVAAQLAPTGDRRVVDALVELLDDADGFVREAATIGLQSQGDPAALGPLRARLRRERKDRAAKAGAKRAIRALEKSADTH
jgi:HEAT repeat protein